MESAHVATRLPITTQAIATRPTAQLRKSQQLRDSALGLARFPPAKQILLFEGSHTMTRTFKKYFRLHMVGLGHLKQQLLSAILCLIIYM